MFPNGLQTSWWVTGVCLTLITNTIGSRQSISNYNCCAEALRLRSTLRNVFVDNHGRATPVTLVQSCCPIPPGEAGGGQDRRNYRQTGSERFHHFLQLCSLTLGNFALTRSVYLEESLYHLGILFFFPRHFTRSLPVLVDYLSLFYSFCPFFHAFPSPK